MAPYLNISSFGLREFPSLLFEPLGIGLMTRFGYIENEWVEPRPVFPRLLRISVSLQLLDTFFNTCELQNHYYLARWHDLFYSEGLLAFIFESRVR